MYLLCYADNNDFGRMCLWRFVHYGALYFGCIQIKMYLLVFVWLLRPNVIEEKMLLIT